MSGPVLKVDPKVLQAAGATFDRASDGLARVAPDAAMSGAAAGVPQLATAAACGVAQADIAAEVTAAAEAARQYGESLGTAAGRYVQQDQSAASAVQGVQI
ncbi:type VII secretion target [Mycolicibacterium sp.]|uniref:type VII secretion target n=1 Tax=Mycolicibacterium sp. TaxID=2320850 RepID=UPI001A27ABA1|nr:type VII secretion target [Mycolicibacterium sp.]MBJ7341908.1 hypothetical protein [Mycolicibacterium sp.]